MATENRTRGYRYSFMLWPLCWILIGVAAVVLVDRFALAREEGDAV